MLTAWKEREAGYRSRRARIEQAQGHVPAYAEEVEVARLRPSRATPEEVEEQEEAERDEERTEAIGDALTGPEMTAESVEDGRGDSDGDGARPEPAEAGALRASTTREERRERRRRQRQNRRKHGRQR